VEKLVLRTVQNTSVFHFHFHTIFGSSSNERSDPPSSSSSPAHNYWRKSESVIE
jgi:hypothetical protein